MSRLFAPHFLLSARAAALAIPVLFSVGGCAIVDTVQATLNLEHRYFVRVPGARVEQEARLLALRGTGWCFRHVVEAPPYEGEKVAALAKKIPQNWYLAWKMESKENSFGNWWTAEWGRVRRHTVEIARDTHTVFGTYPVLIEPDFVFKEKLLRSPENCPAIRTTAVGSKPGEVKIRALPKQVWSNVRDSAGKYIPSWHLDDNHTQLAKARSELRRHVPGGASSIRIGILDTGFDARHPTWPARVLDRPEGNAFQALLPPEQGAEGSGSGCIATPGQILGSHGTGALSILAGRRVRVSDPHGQVRLPADGMLEIGAVPEAEIVTARIAPNVASLSTANFAYGIDYASRVMQCDVLSISNGGSPSQMWADAVNAAYDRGTAMFAATGDYFPWPGIPGLQRDRAGILIPSSSVYPAGFRRVMGVTGVSASGASYARTDWPRYLWHFWKPRELFPSFMRASYGPDGVTRSVLSVLLRADDRKATDPAFLKRDNRLRAHPIATYAPGVSWAVVGKPDQTADFQLDLDGGGTSSATPQAAAAAALWLARYRRDIEGAHEWRHWRKAEATYTAMIQSAQRPWAEGRAEDQEPDAFLGAGILKAEKMLQVSYNQAKAIRGANLTFPYTGKYRDGKWRDKAERGSPRDYYDGSRSLVRALRGPEPYEAEGGRRAGLLEAPQLKEREAIVQLMHNSLLAELWQKGKTPVKSEMKENWLARFFRRFGPSALSAQQIATQAEALADQALNEGATVPHRR